MKAIISPAKTLDLKAQWPLELTQEKPVLESQAQILIENLKKLSVPQIAKLMSLSDRLAKLSHEYFSNWEPTKNYKLPSKKINSHFLPAIFMFRGDVYQGLDPTSLSPSQIKKVNDFTYILSGLYGILKPLSMIMPYRLEMGTKLSNPKGKDLYSFWQEQIAEAINHDLIKKTQPILVNLASEEYYLAIKNHLNSRIFIIHPVFLDRVKGKYKIVSFYAKRARGLMLRFMINNTKNPENLKYFSTEGYHFDQKETDIWNQKKFSHFDNQSSMVFLREH